MHEEKTLAQLKQEALLEFAKIIAEENAARVQPPLPSETAEQVNGLVRILRKLKGQK